MIGLPAEPHRGPERRRSERVDTSIEGTLLHEAGADEPLLILDLSIEGFRATAARPPRRKEQLWVRLPGTLPQRIAVMWVNGGQFGATFAEPLPPAQFRRLAEAFPPSAEAEPTARSNPLAQLLSRLRG